jgi:hypothetical protein
MASAVLEGLAQREAALQAEMEEMQEIAAEVYALTEREDAALSDVGGLDEATLAEVAASMQAAAAAEAPQPEPPPPPVLATPSEAIESMMENLKPIVDFDDED